MRTLGLVLIGVIMAAAVLRLVSPARRTLAASLFSALWLAACVLNLRNGLANGYTLREELPIHLALFILPATLAWSLARRDE